MKTESSPTNKFAVCLNNEGYKASLEVGKIYRIIPDETAEINSLIRVIDESGEDYAFSVNRFYPLELPKPIEEALLDDYHWYHSLTHLSCNYPLNQQQECNQF